MIVSIIVPVYNVEKYIVRCFDSIQKQTFQNIECIFIDDCSPDKSSAILEQKISEYTGVIDFKIIKHETNKGLSSARNTGTKIAKGEYVYYLDSDDEITPDCIELLVRLAKKYKGVEIVQGNTKTIPSSKEDDWRDIGLKNYPEYTNRKAWIKKYCFAEPRIPVNAWNKLINKEFVIKNNLFFKEGILHEDEHWMFYVAKKIKSIAFTKKYCYIHHIVHGSIMQSKNKGESLESALYILNEFSSSIDNELPSYQRKYLYNKIRYKMFSIDCKSEEKKYIPLFQNIVKKNVWSSLKSARIIDCFALSILLAPPFIFRSFVGEKIYRLFIKLM